MEEPLFLTLAEVFEIHTDQIKRYGGDEGLRDLGLLESALAQPEATFAGQWLHHDLYEMATAYAYHLCQNHPFIDGNKRVALACALVFFEINEIKLMDPKGILKRTMLAVASGKMSKQELTLVLRKLGPGR